MPMKLDIWNKRKSIQHFTTYDQVDIHEKVCRYLDINKYEIKTTSVLLP